MIDVLVRLVVHFVATRVVKWLTRYVGIVCVVSAVFAAFLFPEVKILGTETPTDRYVTALALLAGGLLLLKAKERRQLRLAAVIVICAGAVAGHAALLFMLAVGPALVLVFELMMGDLRAAVGLPPAVAEAEHHEEAGSDIVESVAIAFVYALVVREFSCEAFKIPTESMNPTILGNAHDTRTGDQLLAAKAPLLFSEPKRWSIVVFRYPLFRATNYIKRLVGMPGEHLEIRDGDIYANGKVVSKPDEVQETLWFPVLPDRIGGPPAGGLGQAFRADGGETRFDADGATLTARADAPAWIVHDNGKPDVRVAFDADASQLGETGAVLVRLDGDGRRIDFEARRDGVWMTAPGVARTKLDVEGLGASPVRYSFSVADRVVRVWRRGRLAARVETADERNTASRREEAWFGVTGGTAHIANIVIETDLQYSSRGSGQWDIPEGCYFMLGDNTNASRDSREWQGNVFRLKDGREFVCDVTGIRLDDGPGTAPSIRTTPDGQAYEIWDSYGAHRVIAKSDLVGGTYKLEPQPFVRREDLVGRAFFIFFPLKSEGTWRPRLLP